MVESCFILGVSHCGFKLQVPDEWSCIFLRQGSYCFCDGVREFIEKEQYKNI